MLTAKTPETTHESWTAQFIKKSSLAPLTATALEDPIRMVPAAPSAPPAAPPLVEPLNFNLPSQPPAVPAQPPPDTYVESPLTKARRIDAQNTWREEQLKSFFTSKTDRLKSQLSALRGPSLAEPEAELEKSNKNEPETAMRIADCKGAETSIANAPETMEAPRFKLPEQLPVAFASPVVVEAAPPAPLPLLEDELPPSLMAEDPLTPPPPMTSAQQQALIDQWIVQAEECLEAKDGESKAVEESTIVEVQTVSPSEEIRRQRLKERQEKAIERRKELMKRAMDQRQAPSQPPVPFKKPSLSSTVDPRLSANSTASSRLPMRSNGPSSFKPPVKLTTAAPIKPAGPTAAAAAQAPQVKRTLPALPPKPLPKPTPLPVKLEASQPATFSPAHNNGEEDDEAENMLPPLPTTHQKTTTHRRPDWAKTPALAQALAQQQRQVRPEDIFGEVQPVKLEDFFRDTGKKYTRSRTSNINWRP